MNLRNERLRKSLRKRAKKGFRGFPVATIAFYGPDDKKATKVVVGILPYDGADPDPLKKWFADDDVRKDPSILAQIDEFLRANEPRSIAMAEKIIGCPHEEGIDYPEGDECPLCPFWKGRDRWAGVDLDSR